MVSGQLPLDAHGRPLSQAPFAAQALQTLEDLDACLDAKDLTRADLTRADLVQVRVYLTGVAAWPEFDAVQARWLGEHRPARVVVGARELHPGVAVAAVPVP